MACACVYMCVYVCICVFVCICLNVYVYVFMNVYFCVCFCIYFKYNKVDYKQEVHFVDFFSERVSNIHRKN